MQQHIAPPSLNEHNPDAKRDPKSGLYLIYYMGSSCKDPTSCPTSGKSSSGDNLEFNQRVGMAWSHSPYGPWTRSDPIVNPGAAGKWDDGFTTNPGDCARAY